MGLEDLLDPAAREPAGVRPGQARLARRPLTGGSEALQEVAQKLVPELLAAFPGAARALADPFEVPQAAVERAALPEVGAWLRAKGFNLLLDVGGVDYLPRQPRFEVVYQFLALPALWRLCLRVAVPEEDPSVPSVAGLWPAADPAEREVYDLFGIVFTGHPNLKRILLPDQWEGHPLRKDYPLRGPRDLQTDRMPAARNRFFAPRLPGNLDPPDAAPGGEEG